MHLLIQYKNTFILIDILMMMKYRPFRYPNAVKAVFCSLFGIFVAFLLAIAIFTKFTPAYDVMHSLGTDIYIAPWTRVLPYLIGVAAGYAMFTFNGVMPLGEVSISITLPFKLIQHCIHLINR